LLIQKLMGINANPRWVDYSTLIVFLTCFCLSIVLNTRDRRKRKQKIVNA
jgi:hypothetical protein